MKIYKGNSAPDGSRSITVHEDGKEPYHLKHIIRYSLGVFQWGPGMAYWSGPADTALSILTDCLGPKAADRLYGPFKWDFIAKAGDKLNIDEKAIRDWAVFVDGWKK